jgi:SulP family sulfate permease
MARAVRPRIAWLGRDPATGHLGELGTAGVQPVEDVAIVLVGSELFFANVGTLRDAVIEEVETSGPRAVVLDAGAVSSIDTTAADLLVTLVGELADRDVAFLVSRLGPSARAALVAGGLELGGRAFGRTDEAVSAAGASRSARG